MPRLLSSWNVVNLIDEDPVSDCLHAEFNNCIFFFKYKVSYCKAKNLRAGVFCNCVRSYQWNPWFFALSMLEQYCLITTPSHTWQHPVHFLLPVCFAKLTLIRKLSYAANVKPFGLKERDRDGILSSLQNKGVTQQACFVSLLTFQC